MCGRYSLTKRQAELIERFGIEQLLYDEEPLLPRYNIAPSQMVPVVIVQDNKRSLAMFKWGLVPSWAKDLSKTKPVINARCETMAEKPFFKQLVSKKRCLIPSDGFYEWRTVGKQKMPVYIQETNDSLFAFAGLWDKWVSADGEVLNTCTIITTAANSAVSAVHDRMPVFIRPQDETLWLNTQVKDMHQLMPALQPLDSASLKMRDVSTLVNSVKVDSAEILQAPPLQAKLF